jgi:hypothetical protein
VTKFERLLNFHAKPLLGLTEKVEGIGYLSSGFIFVKHYIAGVTDRRLILVQVTMGFFELKAIFLGLFEFSFQSFESLNAIGYLSLKHITIRLKSGEQYRYRLNEKSRVVSDQRHFFEALKDCYHCFESANG